MNPDPFNRPILWIPVPVPEPAPLPDWQKAKIDAACDFWELQLMGIRG